jgi:hypothetical protein
MYDVGDRARLTFHITDVNGVPANGTVVLTVTKPDQSTTVPATVNPQTGSYTADVDLDQAGRWTYRWVSTGAVVTAQSGTLDVDAAVPTGIVSLSDARSALNMTSTANDEELRRYIDAATDFVESRIGPVVRRTVTQTLFPQGGKLLLDGPVISLTTVTGAHGYVGTYDVSAMYLDNDIVYPAPYSLTFIYPVTVTYVAGRVIVPALIRQAALDYIAWLWEDQRGAAPLPMPGDNDFTVQTPATVPFKILQALEPYRVPAIA